MWEEEDVLDLGYWQIILSKIIQNLTNFVRPKTKCLVSFHSSYYFHFFVYSDFYLLPYVYLTFLVLFLRHSYI